MRVTIPGADTVFEIPGTAALPRRARRRARRLKPRLGWPHPLRVLKRLHSDVVYAALRADLAMATEVVAA